MKIYLCFWRQGQKEVPERDFIYITTDATKYDRWFQMAEQAGDKHHRAYGHTVVYRHKRIGAMQVDDYSYRGGPGV